MSNPHDVYDYATGRVPRWEHATIGERLKAQNSIMLWKDCKRHRWVSTHRLNVERCSRCPVLRIVKEAK